MNDRPVHLRLSAAPTDEQAARAVREAHLLFNRTLCCWASDVLALRRGGLMQLRWEQQATRNRATQRQFAPSRPGPLAEGEKARRRKAA
jgi:hypothetical protein